MSDPTPTVAEHADVQVYKLLNDAVFAYTKIAPNQEALEGFNDRVQQLLRDLPSPRGTKAAPVTPLPRVYLAMPYLGHVELGTAKSAYVFASQDKLEVRIADRQSSLLAFGLNRAWCECLNSPTPYDYFAILHADIVPHGPFLDVLRDELEAGGFDVMHAVAPIKDRLGLTSTAVGEIIPHQNGIHRFRRLTMKEILRLPETFDLKTVTDTLAGPWPDDVPCLLPNTGCMLIKLGPWCQRFSGFCIEDHICVQTKDGPVRAGETDAPGKLLSVVNPEDWNLGRWCARNGLKVGGTRKVRLDHISKSRYPNYEVGESGWEHDEHFMQGVKS